MEEMNTFKNSLITDLYNIIKVRFLKKKHKDEILNELWILQNSLNKGKFYKRMTRPKDFPNRLEKGKYPYYKPWDYDNFYFIKYKMELHKIFTKDERLTIEKIYNLLERFNETVKIYNRRYEDPSYKKVIDDPYDIYLDIRGKIDFLLMDLIYDNYEHFYKSSEVIIF